MGKFEDATAGLEDLAAMTSAPITDAHPDDVVEESDADGDTVRLAYVVQDDCEGDGPYAGIYFQTTPAGALLHPDAAEALAMWLVDKVALAKERGLA